MKAVVWSCAFSLIFGVSSNAIAFGCLVAATATILHACTRPIFQKFADSHGELDYPSKVCRQALTLMATSAICSPFLTTPPLVFNFPIIVFTSLLAGLLQQNVNKIYYLPIAAI